MYSIWTIYKYSYYYCNRSRSVGIHRNGIINRSEPYYNTILLIGKEMAAQDKRKVFCGGEEDE